MPALLVVECVRLATKRNRVHGPSWASRVRGVQIERIVANCEEGVKVSTEERAGLIGQMGGDVTSYSMHAERGEWPAARLFLTRLTAAVGAMAMEVDENDPVERQN
jgi:hypothetical protein